MPESHRPSSPRIGRLQVGRLVRSVLLVGALSGALALTSVLPVTGPAHAAEAPARACGTTARAPKRYASVVVFAFENRTWNGVGAGFGPAMPYLQGLGRQCAWFPQWDEAQATQNSLSQYVAQVTGAPQSTTLNDCTPGPTCSTRADNLFRQLRRTGRRAVNYVEGATVPCSADGNAAKHVPALYLWGADDRAHCADEVQPIDRFDPNHLPAFAFITPTLCNDGHDCDDATVDAWAAAHIQPVLDTRAYRAGKVAVFVWYDEDRPVPNLWVMPSATAGPHPLAGAGYSGTLKAWQSMLGVRCLKTACTAVDMRVAANG